MGPDRLTEVGPPAGAVALAVAVEVGIGAAIALFGPRGDDRRHRDRDEAMADAAEPAPAEGAPRVE
ncbi:MAG: hypothetical protein PGN24_08205 [Microbacterium arborescens]